MKSQTRKTMLALVAAPLLAAALAGSAPALAQSGPAQLPPAATGAATTLMLAVEGRVTRTPDVAELSGGVVTLAPTAAAAMANNARAMNRVVAAIRKAGIADRDIQTQGIGLQPQYRYDNNSPPVLTGYQATNTVAFRVRKVADTGTLLDALVGAGANQINGPNFTIADSAGALDEARAQAVMTARSRAALYAKAAGLRVRRIASISEAGSVDPGPRPMMMAKGIAAEADSTAPIVPGEVALIVNVAIAFELE
jgi:uncharacterized protein YggE